jgi:hypothetical protein
MFLSTCSLAVDALKLSLLELDGLRHGRQFLELRLELVGDIRQRLADGELSLR